MDMQTLEDEIYNFNTLYFNDTNQRVDDSLDFVENNQLIIPKANYIIVIDFLEKVLKKFRVLDSKFLTKTLDKLLLETKELQNIYSSIQLNQEQILKIFNTKFLSSSAILSPMAKELLYLKNKKDKTEDEIEHQRRVTKNFKELRAIYYEMFSELFSGEMEYLSKGLKEVLNSKAFYLDKLIWQEAIKSIVIRKHFQTLKITNSLNTKNYLLYTTDLMRPYTDEYKYLQSCLRIYK